MHHYLGYNVHYANALLDNCRGLNPLAWSKEERLDLVAAWRMGGEL